MSIRSMSVFAAFSLMSYLNIALADQLPARIDDVPVFQGAVRDEGAETERQNEFDGTTMPPEKLAGGEQTQTFRFYHSPAIADEVFEFYRKTLNAKELDEEIDPFKLKPGQSTPISYAAFTYEEDEFEDVKDPESNVITYPGRALKSAYEKDKRKTFRGGRYLAEAHFAWSLRLADGELVNFIITVLDDSIREKEDPKTHSTTLQYERGTQIHFLRESYKEPPKK